MSADQEVTLPAYERFQIVHGDEIEKLPPPEWLVDGFLVQGSLAMLYGPTDSFKSFSVLDVAGCVAAGVEWHGRETRQGNVIYVAAEGVGDLGRRTEAFRLARGLDQLSDMTYVLDAVNLHTGKVNLHTGKGDDSEADLIAEVAADLDSNLIIFDTLARCMAGGDESFGGDMAKVVASADRLRKRNGATVLLVHHTGHDPRRERGSSVLKAACDTVIKQTSKGLGATLRCEKMKMAARFKPIHLQLTESGLSLAVVPSEVSLPLKDNEIACARLVPPEGISHGDWKTAFVGAGIGSERTFNRYVNLLAERGLVEKRQDGQHDRYFLTTSGQDMISAARAN